MRILVTWATAALLVAAEDGEQPVPELDEATRARAEAAADAIMRGEDPEAEDPRSEADPAAVGDDDRAAILKAEVALLEARTLLGKEAWVPAGEAFLTASGQLDSVTEAGREALGPRYRTARRRLTDLAQELLASSRPEAAEAPAEGTQAELEKEPTKE